MFKFLTFLWRPALPSPSLTTTSAASVPQHIPRSHTTAHAAYLHTKMLMLSPCYPLAHERLYQPALLFCLQIFSRFLLHYKAYQIWTPQGSCWCAGPLHLTLICLILVQHPGDLPGFLIDGELFGEGQSCAFGLSTLSSRVHAVKSTNLTAKKESSWASKQSNMFLYLEYISCDTQETRQGRFLPGKNSLYLQPER